MLLSGVAATLTGVASYLSKADPIQALSEIVVGLGLIGKALFKPSKPK